MARKKQKIKVISYCYVQQENGECVLTCTDDLNAEQKERLAISIQYNCLTAQFGGVAQFYAPGFEITKDKHGRTMVKRLPETTAAV